MSANEPGPDQTSADSSPEVVSWHDAAPGVALVELANPPMNALSRAVADGLTAVVDRLESGADEVRAVVLAGAGRAFSAGAEIAELGDLADPVASDAQVRRMHTLFDRWERLAVPTVAALDGAAVGGGLELALSCDLRIAVPRVRLGLPEVGLGLIPGAGGTQRLPAVVGRARAMDLILSCELIDAFEAERIGLVGRVVTEGTARDAALAWATALAARPARAVRAAKTAVLAAGTDDGYVVEREHFVDVSGTADAAEGIAAFLDHRDPTFTHR